MIPSYVECLCDEIRKTGSLFRNAERKLTAVYMGGGTPGILSADQMERVLSTVKQSFELTWLRECCVEIGRPDTVTEEKLTVLKKMGVERISINPQTVKDETLCRIGRGHSAEDFYRAMELAKKYDLKVIEDVYSENAELLEAHKKQLDEESLRYEGLKFISEEELFLMDDIDAVVVEPAVPNLIPMAQKCIDKGWHIHLDKPAGVDLEEYKKHIENEKNN